MKPTQSIMIAFCIYSMVEVGPASAQNYTTPLSISANVGGTTNASDVTINMTGNGSGVNGPSTAQYGQNLSCSKTNWKTASTVGEIDCLNVNLRQGGPGSDGSGMLVNVQNAGLGNLTDAELTASVLNPTTNATPYAVDLQLGVITSAKQMYGAVVNAVNGVGAAALYVNAPPSTGSWNSVLQAAKLGHVYFNVDGNGNLTTDGKISTAALTTSGSIQAESGVVTPVPASRTIEKINCGTTIRSTETAPVKVIIPAGLPLGCHVNVIQATDAAITFEAQGVQAETAGSTDRLAFRTGGRFAEAELVIDSPKTFLLHGEVEPTSKISERSVADQRFNHDVIGLAALETYK